MKEKTVFVPESLTRFFEENPRVAIAFSGGVDSSYLLYAASNCAADVTAYYVQAAFQPAFELKDAEKIAAVTGAKMRILTVDVLSDDTVTANPPNRCYYCKQKIFGTILKEAAADGYSVILDGTNASDDSADRPGMKALAELSVLSPLRTCGLTKGDVRALSRQAGLFTWKKPSYACLATRIPTSVTITKELLERTEKAEDYLHELGFSNFRVRLLQDAAKLQIESGQFELLLRNRERIKSTLKQWYSDVVVDLEPRG